MAFHGICMVFDGIPMVFHRIFMGVNSWRRNLSSSLNEFCWKTVSFNPEYHKVSHKVGKYARLVLAKAQ